MLPVNRRIAPPKLPPDAVERMERDAANAGKNEPVSRFRKIVPYVRGFFGAVLVAGVALGVAWSARRWVLTSTRFAGRPEFFTQDELIPGGSIVAAELPRPVWDQHAPIRPGYPAVFQHSKMSDTRRLCLAV